MDRNFLFGVIAVLLGQATPQQVMDSEIGRGGIGRGSPWFRWMKTSLNGV